MTIDLIIIDTVEIWPLLLLWYCAENYSYWLHREAPVLVILLLTIIITENWQYWTQYWYYCPLVNGWRAVIVLLLLLITQYNTLLLILLLLMTIIEMKSIVVMTIDRWQMTDQLMTTRQNDNWTWWLLLKANIITYY